MLRLLLGVVVALMLALPSILAPAPTSAEACRFVLGFKALHDAIPDRVGDCVDNEAYNQQNGDALQHTTAWHGKGGLLAWRKADNWTAFTDGASTWVNGPYGVQKRPNSQRFSWEAPDPEIYVLTLADMPAGFSLATKNTHYSTNEQIAPNYPDPVQALAMLASFGRVLGYQSTFNRNDSDTTSGPTSVFSQAIVHTTPEGAKGYLQQCVDRERERLGKEWTLDLARVSQFGDEATAFRKVHWASPNGWYYSAYFVLFRKGKILGIVEAGSLSGRNAFEEAVRYARIMESRIP